MIVIFKSQLSENDYFREEAGRLTDINWEQKDSYLFKDVNREWYSSEPAINWTVLLNNLYDGKQ
jgi:hypothetical protein